METIIDTTYFQKGFLFIPNNKNINSSPSGSPSVQSDLDLFVEVYERELLLNALGVTLYNELQSELPTPTMQKYIDLVNGSTYTINSNTKIWNGLKGSNTQSLIAFFVYCQYLRNDNSIYTTTGVIQNTTNNAERVDASPKFVKNWGLFLDKYQGSLSYHSSYPTIITNKSGMIGVDYYGNSNVEVNLYQYLMDQNELDDTNFPDFEFRFYESYNTFGI